LVVGQGQRGEEERERKIDSVDDCRTGYWTTHLTKERERKRKRENKKRIGEKEFK